MSYKAICLTNSKGKPYLLSYSYLARQQAVVDWIDCVICRLNEAIGNLTLLDRNEDPEPVMRVADETLCLFKPVHSSGPEETYFLMCFMSSYKTPMALQAFEKVHAYIQAFMRLPSNHARTQYRQLDMDMTMQDIFSKMKFVSKRRSTDSQAPVDAVLEAAMSRLFCFQSLNDTNSLQLLNRATLVHQQAQVVQRSVQSKYHWIKATPKPTRNVEEIEAIHEVARTLAAEVKIGRKRVKVYLI